MQTASNLQVSKRYGTVAKEKAGGATYTPPSLANFVASQIVQTAALPHGQIHVLDPAVGDGELLLSLLEKITRRTTATVVVSGFDTDPTAVALARQRLQAVFPKADLRLEVNNFLDFALAQRSATDPLSLFTEQALPQLFDMIIANPPYVRTQIMGSKQAQQLAAAFGLTGRVDLYHAFLIAMARVLKPSGTAGIIVSNRFMTTRAGAGLRAALRARFDLRHIWDLGDTKLFDAAVLPAVILAQGRNGHHLPSPAFTSIYETDEAPTTEAAHPLDALAMTGTVALKDGRRFHVQHGILDASGTADDLWRIATNAGDTWLARVRCHTWKTFGGLGKIRVGVKTCADKIFIRNDWHTLPTARRPELLRPLTTHHIAGRFRAIQTKTPYEILYTHESIDGQRQPVELTRNPKSRAYLELHRAALEARTYVLEAGRQWYELWVPQDPAAWEAPKLVFRDISERPTFWIDRDSTIVNGDCYWMTAERHDTGELLWLAAAIANSTFIEAFYDHRFNNKLYAGRRRFMTQYVEQFPLPAPNTELAREIITITKKIYDGAGSPAATDMEAKLDRMVWQAFGLSVKEVTRQRDL